MFRLLSPLAIAGALLSVACLGAAPAQALSKATFVSGKGNDTGTCADPENPCRSFQFALGQTAPFGEVKALDPANYGAMVITQSISISGVEGAGINHGAGDAIAINAGPNDTIYLTHLTVDGITTGKNGIVLNSGGSLTITDCVVRNFTHDGILLRPAGANKFLIGDTLVSNNSFVGVNVVTQGSAGSPIGTLDHVSMNRNGNGIIVTNITSTLAMAVVTAVASMATNSGGNGGVGFTANGGVLRLARSAATGNAIGVNVISPVESFGDNDIRGNGTDVFGGTLTPVALK